jgi:CrcB protein
MRLVAVMTGGALGTLARWAVELTIPSVGGFPLATLLINVTGAFGLGLVGVVLLERLAPTRSLRPLLGIGFLGAYTTFSTMAMEGVRLLDDDRPWTGGTYSGTAFSGGAWNGQVWSGRRWSSGSGTGRRWSGSAWTSGTWSGRMWSGSFWSGRRWSGGGWM